MRTITKEAYKFSELSKTAKQKAVEELWDTNVGYSWWIYTYEDAEQVGLKISGFEIDGSSYCEIDFITTAKDVADSIVKNHGEDCETYKTAMKFIKDYTVILVKWKLSGKDEDDYDEYFDDEGLEDLNDQFRKDLGRNYLKLLREDYEYRTSETAIIESIECNDYEFTKDGTMI